MLLNLTAVIIKNVAVWGKYFILFFTITLALGLIGALPDDPILGYLDTNSQVIMNFFSIINLFINVGVLVNVVAFMISTYPLVFAVKILLKIIGNIN